jgi:group I intron endonuclease
MEEYLIYCWTNLLNGMKYVGYTKNTVEIRLYYHLKGGKYFHKALHKYGVENFSCEVFLRGLTLEEACYWEIYYIDKLDTLWPNGYNLTKGGNGNHNKPGDFKLSETTRKAISFARKGYPLGPMKEETKRKLSASLKGYVFSEERNEKISKALSGKSFSPEHIQNRTNSIRKITKEQVQAIRKENPFRGYQIWADELGVSGNTIYTAKKYSTFKNEP